MLRFSVNLLKLVILLFLLICCLESAICNENSSVFNVLDYGAKGDGTTDDTKTFEAAWIEACKVEGSTIVVPSDYDFLVGPISFSGPHCEENIVFLLDGRIIAPTNPKIWGSGLLQWLEFKKLNGISVKGKGTIDGQGSVWWQNTHLEDPDDDPNYTTLFALTSSTAKGKMPRTRPTALRFYGCSNVVVTGITIQNSPKAHLKFDSCVTIQVSGITISSPEDSPNTDGIHLQNSQNVVIHSSDLACGDDCISIQTGTSAVFIHDVKCGPGHGFSIGGLGNDNTKACVSNITVRDSTLHNTLTGVRIKTWQGGSGSVQGIMFSNIQVSDVETPIIIDQFYCDKSKCKNQTSAVAISGVSYQSIKGTYSYEPLHFACSDSVPCTGVSLADIQLKPSPKREHFYGPYCWQTYGELKTKTTPPIDCIQPDQDTPDYDSC
ncbi:polygalacturonase At1g48100 isoform X1 [Nicotiana sylvestris]|uniref:Polygalacturonase At1g48100 isoform X1 n=1 Tax=Nicotiana sylvestris TaxID=4096 RepID=A0A1U7W3K8_NICSY|nr:PREDICTED: polygalacturonase At1g48100 isoform X1 [Nicotiana sylvestris]